MPFSPTRSRPRAELSQQEMRTISQAIGREFAPRFFRRQLAPGSGCSFSSQELRDIGCEISREFAPNRLVRPPGLVLLALSPQRLHAYWQAPQPLSTAMPQSAEAAQEPLTLRVFPHAAATAENRLESPWLDLVVARSGFHADIPLPDAWLRNAVSEFSAVLGETAADGAFKPLLVSNSATAPARYWDSLTALPQVFSQFILPNLPAASSVSVKVSPAESH